jgi:DNA polymerase elongation subunit (family B)
MDSINDSLQKKIKSKAAYEIEKRSESYWICLRNKGAIPTMLLRFRQQREYYRKKGNEPMSQALKVMMNSIYGLFGSDGIFAFQDYRVAELVTAFARLKLFEMKKLAKDEFGMNIMYGDTDSIFVSNIENKTSTTSFTASCKLNLGVEVDRQNTFIRSILLGKKHYIGVQPDGKVTVKGMEGKKRDRPKFFNQVFNQLIDDYKNNNPDLSVNILNAFRELESAEVDPTLLAYSVVINKDPDQYRHYTPQHKIGTSLNKDAGSLIQYYKTGQQEDGYKGYSTDYRDLNVDVYKQELWKIVKEILRLQGYDIKKIEEQTFPEEEGKVDITASENNFGGSGGRRHRKHSCEEENDQRNDSLTNYCLPLLQPLRAAPHIIIMH